jgi:hypothetical protein
MLVLISLLRAKIEMDVNGQHRTVLALPHHPPNISPTGHRTPIIPSNAIELMKLRSQELPAHPSFYGQREKPTVTKVVTVGFGVMTRE